MSKHDKKHRAPRVEKEEAVATEKEVVTDEAIEDEEADVVMEVRAEESADLEKVDGLAPVWRTVKEVWASWKGAWKLFTGNALVASIAVMILSLLAGIGGVAAISLAGAYEPAATAIEVLRGLRDNPLLLAGVVLGALLYALLMAVISTWMALAQMSAWRAVRDGRDTGIRDSYASAWVLVPSYIWITILATLLTVIGVIGFIIPGILLALCFSMLPVVALLEKGRGMAAVRRAIALVSPHLLGVFWRLFASAVILYLPGAVIGGIVGGVFGEDAGEILSQVYDLVVGPIYLGIVYVTYLELKAIEGRKKGCDLIKTALICFAVAVALIAALLLAKAL